MKEFWKEFKKKQRQKFLSSSQLQLMITLECDLWNTQINIQFSFTFQQLIQTISRRLSQQVMITVKEEQIKRETFGLWRDLNNCSIWVKANDLREEAEVRIGAVIREAELKKQTRGDLKVERTWHERGNLPCLKWFVSQWDEPWEFCCLSVGLFRSISTAGSQFYTWSYKFTQESRLFLPKLWSQHFREGDVRTSFFHLTSLHLSLSSYTLVSV